MNPARESGRSHILTILTEDLIKSRMCGKMFLLYRLEVHENKSLL